ncbi:MAG: hypothetical protein PHT50_01440 [Candidatus Omnitrophica bacterium]|nr:hypothetical protein [Candidatus Omnitrophota bacterium]
MKMAISRNLLYIAAGNDGMYVYDIKDSISPKRILHLSFVKWCSSISVSGGLLFLGQEGSLRVFKINTTNPVDISLIKEISIQGQVENILFEGDMIFASCRSGGLYVFNLKDDFKTLRHIFMQGKTTYALADFQGHIYFNLGSTICALDTKRLTYKKILSLSGPKKIYQILIKNNYAYIYFDELIYVFQIKTPFSLKYKGKNSLPGDHIRQGVMYKNYMYTSAEDAGTVIFDVSVPEKLALKSKIEASGEISGVIVDNNNLLVSDYKGLSIYNITDPLKLESSDKVFIKYPGITKARISQNRMFILYESPDYGPSYVDILEMPEFKKTQSIKFPGETYDIQVRGNKLFAIDAHHLYVYDTNSKQSPKLEYSVSVPGFLRYINFYQNTLFITEYNSLDSDPDMLAFSLDTNGRVIKKRLISHAKINPLGEYVQGILNTNYFDKLLEYGPYTYVTKNRMLYVFLKKSNDLELLDSVLLPDTIRDFSIKQRQNGMYLYLALEDAGLYVFKYVVAQ